MGDYKFGYTPSTNVPLSDALAASAGFPGLIGPLVLDTRPYSWDDRYEGGVDPKEYPKIHLWDGGAYDNLGLESLHDFIEGWENEVDFLLVSDASGRSKPQRYRSWESPFRLMTGVMMDQVRSLRSRAILERFINHRGEPRSAGSFLQIGNSCEEVLEGAKREDEIATLCPDCLRKEQTDSIAEMETEIGKLSQDEFENLFRHGFEVADYTLYGFHADEFNYIGYANSRWY
jgi:NTE family protein